MLMGNPRHDFYKAREEDLRQRQRFVDATNAYNQAHAKRAIKASFIMTNPAEKESTNRQKNGAFPLKN